MAWMRCCRIVRPACAWFPSGASGFQTRASPAVGAWTAGVALTEARLPAATVDGLPHTGFVQVEVRPWERLEKRCRFRGGDGYDEIDVVSGSRFTMEAGSDGSRHHVLDARRLERLDDSDQ